MIPAIPVPADDADVRSLPKIVAALARFANAWRSNDVVVSNDGSKGADISDANVIIKVPPGGGSGSGGGGSGSGDGGSSLAAQWWNVAVNGQAMYCQFDSGTPVASLPSGASVANPD